MNKARNPFTPKGLALLTLSGLAAAALCVGGLVSYKNAQIGAANKLANDQGIIAALVSDAQDSIHAPRIPPVITYLPGAGKWVQTCVVPERPGSLNLVLEVHEGKVVKVGGEEKFVLNGGPPLNVVPLNYTPTEMGPSIINFQKNNG